MTDKEIVSLPSGARVYPFANECSFCGAEAVALLTGLKTDNCGRPLMSPAFVCKNCLPTGKPVPKPTTKVFIELDGEAMNEAIRKRFQEVIDKAGKELEDEPEYD